jgi:hypothetical protein
MRKIDYKRELRQLYKPSPRTIDVVDVPEMGFLMIDGHGDPNAAKAFSDAIETLYAVSYTLKFMIKKGPQGVDYGVMPLEGLWWVDDMSRFDITKKDDWKWTAMIMQPEHITQDLFAIACEQVREKKDPAALTLLRFERFREGTAAQTMHIGPFSEEGPTVQRMHEFIRDSGYTNAGKHHEIYLSDIRRAAPKNWKTVIRQPMNKNTQMEAR